MTYYKYDYEYRNEHGRLIRVHDCTCYKTHGEAERELCDELSELISKGYTEVQGDVKEIELA